MDISVDRVYDVDDCCHSCCCCCSSERKLMLGAEEATLVTSDPCTKSVKKLPYGELGSVEKKSDCGCHGFISGLTDPVPIQPKCCGCNAGQLVDEIVEQLKARMRARGDTAQIVRAEEQLQLLRTVQSDIHELSRKMDAVINHLGLDIAPPQQRMVPVGVEDQTKL